MHSTTIAALTAIAPLVAAHGFVSQISDGGAVSKGTSPQWNYDQGSTDSSGIGWKAKNTDNGFVADTTSTDIACHKAAVPSTHSATVAAGDKIDIFWNTWPDSHKGPVMNYLAPTTDFASATAGGLQFFKISEVGYSAGVWGADSINQASNFTASVTIPSSIKAGNYVLRHEILALHSAGTSGGAQFYPQCVQLVVTGGGSVQPAGEAATSFYKATDPGILIDIYNNLNNYTIPGPAIPAALGGTASAAAVGDAGSTAGSDAGTTAPTGSTNSTGSTGSTGSDAGSTGSTGSTGADAGSTGAASGSSAGSAAPSGTRPDHPIGTGTGTHKPRPIGTGTAGAGRGGRGGRRGGRGGRGGARTGRPQQQGGARL